MHRERGVCGVEVVWPPHERRRRGDDGGGCVQVDGWWRWKRRVWWEGKGLGEERWGDGEAFCCLSMAVRGAAVVMNGDEV